MSLLQQWARALRQAEPYDGPWPRAGERPNSAEAWFTNADARMRPRASLLGHQLYFLPGHDELTVTAYNFPQLHARFNDMQERAGIFPPYRLVIGRDVPGKATVQSNTRTVRVDLSILNRDDFDGFQFWLGHELGHAWQHQNPSHRRIPIRDRRVATGDQWESEADIFAYCLTNDRTSILRGMNGLSQGGGENHAPRAARQGAVASAQPDDCLPFRINTIPHFLRRFPQRQ